MKWLNGIIIGLLLCFIAVSCMIYSATSLYVGLITFAIYYGTWELLTDGLLRIAASDNPEDLEKHRHYFSISDDDRDNDQRR